MKPTTFELHCAVSIGIVASIVAALLDASTLSYVIAVPANLAWIWERTIAR